MRKFACCLLFLLPSLAQAQSSTSTSDVLARQNEGRWLLGVGAGVRDSGYAGEGTRVRPFPWIAYEGERVFWRGLGGGVHLFKGEQLTLDVLLSGRFDGFDIDDLGRAELARNGVDADLLDDRDDAVDAGLAVSWRGRAGELKVSALGDVTDTSGGYELAADYAYALHWGRTTFVPGAGLRWYSRDMANYYYGTTEKEVARGVTPYQPGSVLVPQVSLGFSRPLGERWKLMGGLNYSFLPDEISDSPFMDHDVSGSVGLRIGIAREF